MSDIYQLQAGRIEAILNTHKIPARVWQATVTPRFVRYDVTTALGVRVQQVAGLDEELALGLGASAVRIYRDGGVLRVEVPRTTPDAVDALATIGRLKGIPEATALLGIDVNGDPLMVRLPSPDVAHILIAGATGSGKTELLRAMLASLVLRNQVGKLQLILIDPKGRLAEFADLPHVRGAAQQPGEIAQALAHAVAEMTRRGAASPYPRLIVAVDEMADVIATVPTADEALIRLTQRGREAGVHVIAATQRPSALQVGGAIRANLPTRLIGRVVSPEESKIATGIAAAGAERLLGRGDFLLVAAGHQIRFQAAYLNGSIDRIRDQIRTGAPVHRLAWTRPTTDPGPMPTGAPVADLTDDYTATGVLPRRPAGPTPAEQARIRAAYAVTGSLNQTVAWAYGSKSALTLHWVKGSLLP